MPVANVSQHLQVLRNARLVETEREGNRVVYRLASDSVLRLWLALETVATERLAEVGEIARRFGAGHADGEVSPEEVASLLRTGKAVLIDVRPPLEYESGHLPGALSIPVDELDQRLAELPRDRRIIAYCRGEYCLFADEAVTKRFCQNSGLGVQKAPDLAFPVPALRFEVGPFPVLSVAGLEVEPSVLTEPQAAVPRRPSRRPYAAAASSSEGGAGHPGC